MKLPRLWVAAAALSAVSVSQAETLSIKLLEPEGQQREIGSLSLTQVGDQYRFAVNLNEPPMENYFLSMRPFRCLSKDTQMLCHLAYPYEMTDLISKENLRPLEYALLFISRGATDYGIDPWNGIYYDIAWPEPGSLSFTGEAKIVDLNILASPPDQGVAYPIVETDLHPMDTTGSAYPRLIIE